MHTHTQVMQSSQGNSCYNVHMNMDDASGFYHSCWCFLGLSLIFLSAAITRITTVAMISTTTRAPTAPRLAAMSVEGLVGFSIRGFVTEGEGEEELLGVTIQAVLHLG